MNLPGYSTDPADFARMYERWLVTPMFRPWAELTLTELGLHAGDTVLDLACGTGIAARVARERLGAGARIVGIDISPAMLGVARSEAPAIDWREAGAAALPLQPAEQFSVLICQQGLQFFADKTAAAAQMRRALAAGGRLAVSTWRADDEMPLALDLRRVAERHLGPIDDPRYGYGRTGQLAPLLRDAGFPDVRLLARACTVQLDAQAFVRLNAMALIGWGAAGRTLDRGERQQLLDTIVYESAAILGADAQGRVNIETRSDLALARG